MTRLPSCKCGSAHLTVVKRLQAGAWYYHQMCNLCNTIGYFATPRSQFSESELSDAPAVGRVYDRKKAQYVGRIVS